MPGDPDNKPGAPVTPTAVRPPMPNRQTARDVNVARRRTEAVRMRLAGASWDDVAAALGYRTRGAACQDVSRALKAALKEQKFVTDELREQELQHLDALRATAWAVMEREHVLVSGGKVVRDVQDGDEGEESEPLVSVPPLRDDGPTLQAIDRLLRIQERRSKLLGLDAPVVVDTTATIHYVIEGVDMSQLR